MGRYVFKLPDVGEGTAEAELVGWHVKVGDTVAEDQIVADVMTDKATVEITSPVAGVVVALHGEPGQQSAVGGPLVSFQVEGKGNVAAAPAAAPAPVAAAPAAPQAAMPSDPATIVARSGEEVKSPMVGTVYLQPSPEAPAFVKAGDKVKKGQTLLIVEAMKTMNPIQSPRDGVVVDILVGDAQPVEFGEALVLLEA